MSHSVTIQRANSQRTNDKTIKEQIDYLIKRSLAGNRGLGWTANKKQIAEPAKNKDGLWLYLYRLNYEKIKGRKDNADFQFEQIKDVLAQTGLSTKFGKYAWSIVGNGELTLPDVVQVATQTPIATTMVGNTRALTATLNNVKQWEDISIPQELLTDDTALTNHPHFVEIYGRNAQIRTALSAIHAAIISNGSRRAHCVFHGHAGCGKTTVLLAIERLLGEGAVLRLDATSTTRAGLEKMFFTDLAKVPPVVVMEEIEKANEDALKIWLGALDDRGEIRKVNFRGDLVREIRVVFLCTVNNKVLFDKMMGSDGKEQGALSSRCVNQIYFPRPDELILRQILARDVRKNGGETAWIDPCIKLAQDLCITDPRKVMAFLAGGNRLLTGEYQNDIMEIHKHEQRDKR